jgi:large repetitive protein
VNGTFTASGGSITNATGTDFLVSGGSANVAYAGTINDDVGVLVAITNTTGGTKTFTGAITDGDDGDGSGVVLTSNTGATITFSGGLVLSTGGNPAFTATGGGTVNVCDENPCNASATGSLVNKLTTTTGTALNVANTTIGASNLEFRSISSNRRLEHRDHPQRHRLAGGLKVKGTGSAGSGRDDREQVRDRTGRPHGDRDLPQRHVERLPRADAAERLRQLRDPRARRRRPRDDERRRERVEREQPPARRGST